MTSLMEEANGMAKMLDVNHSKLSQTDIALKWGVILNNSEISEIVLEEDKLIFKFNNDRSLTMKDDGQDCCESRYMSSDDDLKSLIGAQLLHVEIVEAENASDEEYGVHEQMFLKIGTSNGDMTVVTHNEHNGYYGGFDITASWSK